MTEKKYQCQFCGHRFVHEDRFIRHRCKQMIRDEEFRTPEGQAAWLFYKNWMKAHRRLVPNSKSFLHSKFFNAFYKFARFVKTANVPDTDVFIRLMTDKDIDPTIWTKDQVYSLYLEHMDRILSPKKHAEITINTLFDLADDYDVDVSEVFEPLPPHQVIQLLRQRKLSPWILLNSPKFRQFFINKTSSEEKIIMETIIRPQYWGEKFKAKPQDLNIIKKYVAELQL